MTACTGIVLKWWKHETLSWNTNTKKTIIRISKRIIERFKKMQNKNNEEKIEKVNRYVEMCWYNYHCYDRNKIMKIITDIVNENPEETNHTRLGMLAKRRCIGELS